MGLFRKNKTLAELHADAKAAGHAVTSIFHDLADELHIAAATHAAIAEDARDQANELHNLATDADLAASEAHRKAEAIKSLVA